MQGLLGDEEEQCQLNFFCRVIESKSDQRLATVQINLRAGLHEIYHGTNQEKIHSYSPSYLID